MTRSTFFSFDRSQVLKFVLQHSRARTTAGFTLIELMAVLVMVGVLAAIATPSWLSLTNQQRVKAAQDSVLQMMRQTQLQAKRTRQVQQASFRQTSRGVEGAVHGADRVPRAGDWQVLSAEARIDRPETTLFESGGVYRVQFNQQGNANGQIGKLTLTGITNSEIKRCVIVSTLLGTMRQSERQAKPDQRRRYCY